MDFTQYFLWETLGAILLLGYFPLDVFEFSDFTGFFGGFSTASLGEQE